MRIVDVLQRHSWYGRNASAFVDGELLPPEVRRFEAHLAGCGACASAVAHAREWKALADSLPEAALPRSFMLTAAMAAAAKPLPKAGRAAVPYLGLVRAGAGLSVAAFAAVVAFAAFDPGGPNGGRDGATAASIEIQDAAGGAATDSTSNKYAVPESTAPQLGPASGGGVSSSGFGTATVVSSLPVAPSAVAATPGPGEGVSRASDDSGGEGGLAGGYPLEARDSAEKESGRGMLVIGLGLVAAAMLALLGALEVTRRLRRP